MGSVKGTQIDGDVSVGRNVSLGGNQLTQGNAHIKGNVRIDGWFEAPNVKQANKGLFASEDALRSAYPAPFDGWYALVMSGSAYKVYLGRNGRWEDSRKLWNGELKVEDAALSGKVEEMKAKLDTYVGEGIGKVNINHRLSDTFFLYHNGQMVMPNADGAYYFATPYATSAVEGLVRLGSDEKFATAHAAMVCGTQNKNALCVPVATQNRYGVVRLNTLESTNTQHFDVLSLESAKMVVNELRGLIAKINEDMKKDYNELVTMIDTLDDKVNEVINRVEDLEDTVRR